MSEDPVSRQPSLYRRFAAQDEQLQTNYLTWQEYRPTVGLAWLVWQDEYNEDEYDA
jgi:hypothetical protein